MTSQTLIWIKLDGSLAYPVGGLLRQTNSMVEVTRKHWPTKFVRPFNMLINTFSRSV